MRIYSILLFAVAIFFSGCQSAGSPAGNSAAAQNLSPVETMKALNEAAKANDTAKTKALISAGTLSLIEKTAKEQNTTAEELLQTDGGAPFQELPEMRNEKITGDTATVEIKNTVTGEWQQMPFVKENNVWKAALDKFAAQLEKQQMTPAPVSNANTAPDDNANLPKMPAAKVENKK